jgi:LysM repeat protein
MWRFLPVWAAAGAAAFAQGPNPQLEMANLREDVRGLTQRVGELMLRTEQLERENADLKQRLAAAERKGVTPERLDEAVAELNRAIRAAAGTTKTETLQQVSVQLEKLARQTNSALEALAKTPAARPAVTTNFSDDYPKEGSSYVVQKGDTLAVIARKTGAKLQDIVNANKITDPSRIVVGQTLFIPGGK